MPREHNRSRWQSDAKKIWCGAVFALSCGARKTVTEHFNRILVNNREWAARMKGDDPTYFARRPAHQEPHILFIGCSDSRVPTELLTSVAPGELFSHRNIANQVFSTDMNLLSVMQYAIDVLDVEHVVVCGHHNCGGVKAAMGSASYGVVDHWLSNIRNVVRWNQEELDAIANEDARPRRLVELNAIGQVYQLSRSPVVQRSWERGRRPLLHGLVYDLDDGLLRTLVSGIDGPEKARELPHSGHGGRAALLTTEEMAISM